MVDRWHRLVTLFEAASRLPESERETWLRSQCAEDPGLYDEVRSLLDAAKAEQIAARDAPRDPGVAGRRYGPWQAVRLLGTGGMGSVLLVKRADGQVEQTAALKLCRRIQSVNFLIACAASGRFLPASAIPISPACWTAA